MNKHLQRLIAFSLVLFLTVDSGTAAGFASHVVHVSGINHAAQNCFEEQAVTAYLLSNRHLNTFVERTSTFFSRYWQRYQDSSWSSETGSIGYRVRQKNKLRGNKKRKATNEYV